MLFKQVQSDGKVFNIGHERAMFNERTVLVIAFGSNSSARPCGLYAVGFDGEVRLVSESMRDLHCNVSQDGSWAAVSLQGTHETLMQRISRDWLTEGPGYGFSEVMIVESEHRRTAIPLSGYERRTGPALRGPTDYQS